MGGGVAYINGEKCTQCGLCRELCRWQAITDDFIVNEIDCEGCGVCVDLCPEKAIDFPVKKCGDWFISDTRFGPMVHARLGIAEENSGKLVTLVRQQAGTLADENGYDLIITDGPPGVGCPVIASVGGASLVLIVTEPTLSGIHDMERVVRLAGHFKVPAMVCINKYDLNIENTRMIEMIAEAKNMRIAGKIPFDPAFTRSMVQGKTFLEFAGDTKTADLVKLTWETLLNSPSMSMRS